MFYGASATMDVYCSMDGCMQKDVDLYHGPLLRGC